MGRPNRRLRDNRGSSTAQLDLPGPVQRAHEQTPEDLDALAAKANRVVGAKAFSVQDQINAYQQLLDFARTDAYVYNLLLRLLTDRAKLYMGLFAQAVNPGNSDRDAIASARYYGGAWQALTEAAAFLRPEMIDQQMAGLRAQAFGRNDAGV